MNADIRNGANGHERIVAPMTPEQRAEFVVRKIYAREEQRSCGALVEAISAAISEERRNCARLLDAIKDEYIDWCSVTRGSTVDQMQVINMLSKAAQSVRAGAELIAVAEIVELVSK